ncbi:MAG TPA: hypothetical protein PK466_08365 [Thermotogota bacterium]|nr:hypothetical protein [Thermotogota bacterium]HPJ87846.1 hypothetical protein [Thermotogota bacterium]HPR96330.1 hypothetical protein [Thermotogota bacterium]
MNATILEWIGYSASLIVLISLLMSSIIKLRWLNLIGSGIYCAYGLFIGSFPVAVMNAGLIAINIYYLTKIYGSKDSFELITLDSKTDYFSHFMKFYEKDMLKYFPKENLEIEDDKMGFYILRNVVPAAVFIARETDRNTLDIQIDYAIPAYRDFKIGNFIFEDQKDYFIKKGYTQMTCHSINKDHDAYLEKMGFLRNSSGSGNQFIKSLI